MIVAIIVLSVLVFLLCVALLICAFKLFDLNGSLNATVEHLKSVEESRCRIQLLIYKKFNYDVPASDKYLSLEELKLEKSQGDKP
jgi:hypothetical protein